MLGAQRLHVALVIAAMLIGPLVAAEHARSDDDPAIAIRPFGAVPPERSGASARAVRARAIARDAVGAEPIALAVDGAGAKVYWAEAQAGRIMRANLDGTGAAAVVEGEDTPVALVLDVADDRIYWATDGNFPRKIRRARLDGGDAETLVAGEDLNRPGALALDLQARRLYWIESVSGRIRRADLDGSSMETVYEDRILTSFGLALDAAARRLFWSDLTHAVIHAAGVDGRNPSDLVGDDVLDVPTGIALDAGGNIYWADRGAGAIRRAKLDGTGMTDVAGAAQGVVDPRAIALDRQHGKIYWTDLALDEIRRADLGGGSVEIVVRAEAGFARTIAASAADTGAAAGKLTACTTALSGAGARFARTTYKSLMTCLDKMSWVKAVKWRANDPDLAARTCARSLAGFAPDVSSEARSALAEALGAACEPGAHGHALADLTRVKLDDAGATCAAAASLDTWIDCVAQHYEGLVFDAVDARYPRALEWLEEARPFVRALVSGTHADEVPAGAVAGVQAVYDRIAKLAEPSAAAAAAGYPATGLRTAYAADKNDGADAPVAVADDGTVQAGAPLRFRDNGDGTVTDLNTKLVWEKKCDGCGGLHDSLFGFSWSGNGTDDTVWDWLDRLNADGGTGFAGHKDWRIPNIKELVSIVDYERFNPAVSTPFDAALCGVGCEDVRDAECSCTASGAYWSATTFSDFPAHALSVLFNLGLVGDDVKTNRHFVRAVRGPVP